MERMEHLALLAPYDRTQLRNIDATYNDGPSKSQAQRGRSDNETALITKRGTTARLRQDSIGQLMMSVLQSMR